MTHSRKHFWGRAFFVLAVLLMAFSNHALASERMGEAERHLTELIRTNQYDKLKEYLDQHADAIHQEFRGRTILTLAAARGKYEMTRLLLQRGADPNHGRSSGKTAVEELLLSLSFTRLTQNSSREDIENLRSHLRTMSLLFKYGANYDYSYTFIGESGVAFRRWIVEDIVNNVCDKHSFVDDLSKEISEIAERVGRRELHRVRESQFIGYALLGGLLSVKCVGIFGIR